MSIFLLSYGILGYDGRLEELINVSNRVGKTTVVACTLEKKKDNENFYIKDRGSKYTLKNYFLFLKHSIKVYKRAGKNNILIVDDFMAAPIGLVLYLIYKPQILIQDSRELYVNKKMPGFGKYLLYFEKILYKKSNLIICANKERAIIMKDKFKLNKLPYVFENIRFLNGEYNELKLSKKYKHIDNKKINIISSGGCSVERGTLNLVAAMKELPNHKLYIIGKGRSDDYEKVNTYILKENISNVVLIDRVPLEELKYLIKLCDIGIVEYHKKDLNNLYCASGKTYEYMNEGLAIVTTENIPLKELCKTNKVGVADDEFVEGIRIVSDNLSYYKENVKNFMKEISVDSNNQKLADKILQLKMEHGVGSESGA